MTASPIEWTRPSGTAWSELTENTSRSRQSARAWRDCWRVSTGWLVCPDDCAGDSLWRFAPHPRRVRMAAAAWQTAIGASANWRHSSRRVRDDRVNPPGRRPDALRAGARFLERGDAGVVWPQKSPRELDSPADGLHARPGPLSTDEWSPAITRTAAKASGWPSWSAPDGSGWTRAGAPGATPRAAGSSRSLSHLR